MSSNSSFRACQLRAWKCLISNEEFVKDLISQELTLDLNLMWFESWFDLGFD